MTCIRPIAPFGETARASPKLSTRITARIQLAGMRTAARLGDEDREGTGGGAGRQGALAAQALTRADGLGGRRRTRQRSHATQIARAEAASARPASSASAGVGEGRQSELDCGAAVCDLAATSLAGKRTSRSAAAAGEAPSRNCATDGMISSSSAVRWVQRGAARPTIEAAGNGPKYRPSSESADCAFMRKTSPTAMTRQPCQTGSGRPRLSRSRASPTATASTVM